MAEFDHPQLDPENERSIDFGQVAQGLWRLRWRLLVVMAVATVGVVIVAAITLVQSPASTTASVRFRLVFDGADRGAYPNGSAFSRSDLVAPPVLEKVFADTELGSYMSFDRFRAGLMILEENPDLEVLGFDYESRLANDRLTPAERTRLENEYRTKRENLRAASQLQLQFVASGRRLQPSAAVMEKVLDGVLATWAQQAADKGALRHQIAIVTPNVILSDTLNTQTVLIRYDILRRHVSRVLNQIAEVAALPGAGTVRMGDKQISLADLQSSLSDLLAFQLNPLIRRRLVHAVSADEVALNVAYLEDSLAELARARAMAEDRRSQIQEVLRTFQPADTRTGSAPADPQNQSSAAPQLNDSFLDRLIEMAGRSGALEYRLELSNRVLDAGEQRLRIDRDISFYEDTLKVLRSAGSRSAAAASSGGAVAHVDFDKIQERVVEILTQANAAYTEISTRNLNPRTSLYELTSGLSVRTEYGVRPRRVMTTAGGTLLAIGLLLLLGATTWVLYQQRT